MLPVKARDPKRLTRRLTPRRENGVYTLRVCKGLECFVCIMHSPPELRISQVRVKDPLSGLPMRLPLVEAHYCGERIWISRWEGGMMVVDEVKCPITLKGDCLYVKGTQVKCGITLDEAIEYVFRYCEGRRKL